MNLNESSSNSETGNFIVGAGEGGQNKGLKSGSRGAVTGLGKTVGKASTRLWETLWGTHSTGGNVLSKGDTKYGYVLQLFLSYTWIHLEVGWPKMTTENHSAAGS